MKQDDMHRYDDMLDLPHHVSRNHPRMSEENRVAQFMPFAALTGYSDMIEERGRLTAQKPELSEWQQEEINAILSSVNKILFIRISSITVTHVPVCFISSFSYAADQICFARCQHGIWF